MEENRTPEEKKLIAKHRIFYALLILSGVALLYLCFQLALIIIG